VGINEAVDRPDASRAARQRGRRYVPLEAAAVLTAGNATSAEEVRRRVERLLPEVR